MPRENSFSDSDGRSLTPELEDVVVHSPTYSEFPRTSMPTSDRASVKSKKSSVHPPRPRFESHPEKPTSTVPPLVRFRNAARKVIRMHRTSTVLGGRVAGAEPGVDPRSSFAEEEFGNVLKDCSIQVVDYSTVRSTFRKMDNDEFVDFMQDQEAGKREPWVKVRWVNISGLSWDVIKAVSIRYNLHPLALEDVFRSRSHTRSKVDYYQRHLFMRIVCHELIQDKLVGNEDTTAQWAKGSTMIDDEPESFTPGDSQGANGYGMRNRRANILPSHANDAGFPTRPRPRRSTTGRSTIRLKEIHKNISSGMGPAPTAEDLKLEALRERDFHDPNDRVKVKNTPMFIFMLRDGTVISIHDTPKSSDDFVGPILSRLRQRDTVLRSSGDPSLLVHALLDLIVDQAMEVIDNFHKTIKKFEAEVLMKPKMRTVRNLHVISADLILLKRTLDPIKTVVYGLRRYDLDRAAAVIDTTLAENQGLKIEGWMSHKSKIYLADVYDHMEYILTSLEMFTGIADNLVDYTFNLASYDMNEVMRRLTLATIVFMPLTVCTGYFGMNFDLMDSVHGKSEWVFWWTAIIVSVLVVPLFVYQDVIRGVHAIKKKLFSEDRKIAKVVQG